MICAVWRVENKDAKLMKNEFAVTHASKADVGLEEP
jgi:hypothetical protein